MNRLSESDFMSKPETTLNDVTKAAQRLGYIDALLDLQRLMKDDLELDRDIRFAIIKGMSAKKDVYLRPTDANKYDTL
jgi:hypothetical protein